MCDWRRGLTIALPLIALLLPIPSQAEPDWPFHRGRIGVRVQNLTPELREYFEVPKDAGILISRVDPGRPGARAGLEVGDVLLEADGSLLRRTHDLVRVVARVPAGETIEFQVARRGEISTVRLEPEGEPMPWADSDHWRKRFGPGVADWSQEFRGLIREFEHRLEELERRLRELEREGGERKRRPRRPAGSSSSAPPLHGRALGST